RRQHSLGVRLRTNRSDRRSPRQYTGHRSVGRHSSAGWRKETWTESAHSSVAIRTRSLRPVRRSLQELHHRLLGSLRKSRTNVSSRRGTNWTPTNYCLIWLEPISKSIGLNKYVDSHACCV